MPGSGTHQGIKSLSCRVLHSGRQQKCRSQRLDSRVGEVIEDPDEGNGAQARAREKGLDPG